MSTKPTRGRMKYHQFLVSRDLGGAGRVAMDLASLLSSQEKESPVWIPGAGPAWSHAEKLGLSAERYDLTAGLSSSKISSARVNWSVGNRLRTSGGGLVHVHSPHVYGALRHALDWSGLKRIVHIQIDESEQGLRWALRRPPDVIVTCAQFLVEQVRRALPDHCRSRQRIVSVPNAVDTSKFAPGVKSEAKRALGAPPGESLCLMLANLAPHKGQETAIRAVTLLKARGITVHLWLAGTERGGTQTYTQHLRTLIQELGVADRVRLLGQRSDAADLLRATDFFLLPSTCEGLPLSIVEAQATKVPVLAAPTAGVPEVVQDGTTGFLIAADNAGEYARRIEQLLANPNFTAQITEAAFTHTTREHNWQAYSRSMLDLYDEVLDNGAIRSKRPILVGQIRSNPIRWLRQSLRDGLFSVFRRVLATDDGRAIATDALRGLTNGHPTNFQKNACFVASPYSDLGGPRTNRQTSRRSDVIMITARFRSGSTLLWNLFRHVTGCTAYYEPLNERRWFDPVVRGKGTDATHRNVSDYWTEYRGLGELGDYYREQWIRRHLWMDENFWEPDLKRYIEILIEKAPGRPVLQFNRIDFRLAWFRRNFPCAKIVHLYRHPRDQWCSTLLDCKCFPLLGGVADFSAHDKFYLLTWVHDLKYHFPFLEPTRVEHPYQLFYYIWKLSYLFGLKYSDYSLAFEHLIADPVGELERLFGILDVRGADPAALKNLLAAPLLGKWKDYADDAWFHRHESICETVLGDFFATGSAAQQTHASCPTKAAHEDAADRLELQAL